MNINCITKIVKFKQKYPVQQISVQILQFLLYSQY